LTHDDGGARLRGVSGENMHKGKQPPSSVAQWLEYFWLWFSDPTFRNAANKRKAYYEHCLAKNICRSF
jgi:hypothetical protein